jgi:hypothetical protein
MCQQGDETNILRKVEDFKNLNENIKYINGACVNIIFLDMKHFNNNQ